MSTWNSSNKQKQDLSRVWWVGGSPCAGKSTVTARLAEQYGLALYHCDEALDAHLRRSTPAAYPLLHKPMTTPWDELWMRPVPVQIREELAFYREEFPLIVDDLCRFSRDAPCIAEGTALLPELVAPLLSRPHQGLWLIPSAHFQRERYAQRAWIHDILRQCENPTRAFDNWMARDSGFAEEVMHTAEECQLRVLRVDGTQGLESMAALVADILQLSSNTR